MQEALVVRRETHIAAPPAAVFALLTDPEQILRWMGTEAEVEPHPGGLYLVNVTGARLARGYFREVVPVHRLAYSFGYQSFLQAKLGPVAAGDAVAGPVVEVFVGDDGFDVDEVGIGRGRGRGQHVFVVEDVEALVLHRAHVEVRHGDDHEHVEVVFAAEGLLVPAHGSLQRIHGVTGAILLAGLHVDAQRDLAAGRGDEAVLDVAELAADQREQIGGLGPGIVPDREMAAAGRSPASRGCRWPAAPALRLCRPRCGWCRPPSRRDDRENR